MRTSSAQATVDAKILTHRCIIREPEDFTRGDWSDQRSGKRRDCAIKSLLQDVLLAVSGDNECCAVCMPEHRVGERDTLWRGLGRILEPRYPAKLFLEQLVPGEQRAGVSIGSHTEQDEVEAREGDCILASKGSDELLLVLSADREMRVSFENRRLFWLE